MPRPCRCDIAPNSSGANATDGPRRNTYSHRTSINLAIFRSSCSRSSGFPQATDFYLCGPPRFLEDFQKGLAAWGIPWPRVHVEVFGPAAILTPGISSAAAALPHRPDGPAGGGPRVTYLRSGVTVPWTSRFGSLLELAEACAVPVCWACRSRVCHNCESGLIEGELAYAPEPLDLPAEGNALICCSAPKTAVELDL